MLRNSTRAVIAVTLVAATVGVGFGSRFATGADPATETVFVPVTPCRLIDTRPGELNTGPRDGKIDADESARFTAWGTGDADSPCDLPSTATAIATNTVAIAPTARSFMTLFPGDVDNPGTANLNFVADQAPTPNAANIPLDAEGTFNVFNAFGQVHVVIDVNGYFQPSTSVGSPGPIGPEGPAGPAGADGLPGPLVREHGRTIASSHRIEGGLATSRFPAMEINAFGNPVVGYMKNEDAEVWLATCSNAACTEATHERVDSSDRRQHDMTIGADGNPVLAYSRSGVTRIAVCHDPRCGGATIGEIGTNQAGRVSVAIGADGNPIVAHPEGGTRRLAVVKCNDAVCSTFTTQHPTAAESDADDTAITIGVDGNPVIAVLDFETLSVVACADPACTTATISQPDAKTDTGYEPSITIGVDGNPVIAGFDNTDGGVRFVACSNPACSTASAINIGSAGSANVGGSPSVTIGLDGNPVISFINNVDEVIQLARCDDPTCSSSTVTTIATNDGFSDGTAIAIGARGEPLVAYWNPALDGLHMAALTMTAWTPNARES